MTNQEIAKRLRAIANQVENHSSPKIKVDERRTLATAVNILRNNAENIEIAPAGLNLICEILTRAAGTSAEPYEIENEEIGW